ncbi:MAG: outer membrane protein assembly factor BamA [Opitutales bacterium]|nr:outer membrane protein assembly factor BamA [Opitutales bacterium]
MLLTRVSLFLTALLIGATFSQAQPLNPQASEAPVIVERLDVRFDGVKSVSEAYIRGNIQMVAGDEYNQGKIDQSIRVLYGTRLFEFIEVDLERLSDTRVIVTFVVRPKYKIESIEFVGNDRISNRRLLRETELRRGTFLDEFQVASGLEKLREYYLKKRFSNINIDYNVVRDRVRGTAQVTYTIDEGVKIKVDDIRFYGNDSVGERRLRGEMETREWWFFSWLTGGGKFNADEFDEDLTLLETFYKNEGYLDINIPEEEVRLDFPDDENELIIHITVEEGPRYYVGNIDFSGSTIYTAEELRRSMRLQPGAVFSPEKIDEAVQAIRDYYGSQGYLETFVRAERRPNLTTRDIDLVFLIDESDKFFVESINIDGNTKTKSRVILRELALAPGDVFDTVRMRNSEERLKATRFFEDPAGVQLSPEDTNIPGRKDLRIAVREGRTGNFTFGAGFSSLENLVFFAEVTQGNFDIFNWRSGFQGDGQKLRLRFQIGSRSNEIVLAFEEPWLFEQRLGFGFEVYRRQSEFNSSLYDELRTGFEIYLRKRLFEVVDGRIAYGLENVQIDDISSFAPPFLRELAGPDGEIEEVVSKVSLLLLRDTRNRLVFPTRGSRYSVQQNFAGGIFGGDVDYYKVEFRGARYFQTFRFPIEQTLSVLLRGGAIQPYSGNDEDVPFYDRFFLGGPQSLRGFDFREVGPYEGGEPAGGNSYAMASLEYTFTIADPIRVAVFYDAGFVEPTSWDFSPERYNDNFGFGLRIMVMGSPLRLDYGIPITTSEDNEDVGNQFHFSFGSRF